MLGIEKVQKYSVHKHLASPYSVRVGMSWFPGGQRPAGVSGIGRQLQESGRLAALAERSQVERLTSLVSCSSFVNKDSTRPRDCQGVVSGGQLTVGTEQVGSSCYSECVYCYKCLNKLAVTRSLLRS